MAGFNIASPIPRLTAEQLAQLGLAAFKPPAPMGVPGMSAPMPQMGGDGMGLGAGLQGLGAGIGGALRGMGGDPGAAFGRTKGDADLGGYGASPVNPMGGNPNAQPLEVFNPTGAIRDPLTGFWRSIFGPRGGA